LICLLIAGIVGAQFSYDDWENNSAKKPSVSYNELIEPHLLPVEATKKVTFGLNNLLADITWLNLIQYYGGGLPYENFRKLPQMVNLVTELDQHFAYPYIFGLLVLPGENFPKEALQLGYKGLGNKNLAKEWEIPYYLGMVQHMNYKNYKEAGRLFELAAKNPEAPEITQLLAANYYSKANRRETAYALYLVIYETSKNDYVKERAKLYIEHWQLIFALEEKNKLYKEKFGQFPENLNKLVEGKIFRKSPKTLLIADAVCQGIALVTSSYSL
jgi:hypothetical protein